MCVPALVVSRVLSCPVGVRLVGLLEVTVAHVCLGTASGGGGVAGGRTGPAGGCEGVAAWIILRRGSLSSSAPLVVSFATFSTSAGLLE